MKILHTLLTSSKAQRTLWKGVQEEYKGRMKGRSAVKCHLLDMTCLLPLSSHRDNGHLPEAYLISSQQDQSTFQQADIPTFQLDPASYNNNKKRDKGRYILGCLEGLEEDLG